MERKLLRILCFVAGILINSFGIAFITKAALGTSPISSLPYVLSQRFTLTLGQFWGENLKKDRFYRLASISCSVGLSTSV